MYFLYIIYNKYLFISLSIFILYYNLIVVYYSLFIHLSIIFTFING